MRTAPDNLTPLLKQYWDIKNQYSDVILLFRLGDFYEMFGQDAETAAPILEIALTGRDLGKGERLAMCGVPYHSVERYVARLIAAGHRCALCDQVEDARYAKGIVRRKVTRVITPGTVLEDSMLESRDNNFLAAVVPGGDAGPEGSPSGGFGLALCDVSTGEFAVTQVEGAHSAGRLLDELDRFAPRELLLPEDLRAAWREPLAQGRPWVVTPVVPAQHPRRSARETLLAHFGVRTLSGFGCEGMPLAVEAARLVLDYLGQRQLDAAQHLRSLHTFSTSDRMGLDAAARRHLEVAESLRDGSRSRSLLGVMDGTVTPMGGRKLKRWLLCPLLDPAEIRERLDCVDELSRSGLRRGDLREPLRAIADLERLASRASTGTATPRDLALLRNSLQTLPAFRELLLACDAEPLRQIGARVDPLPALSDLLASALVDEPPASTREGGIFCSGYSPVLDELRSASRDGKEWVAQLEARERDRTGIKSLKVGYNGVFGYYLEVTRPNLGLVPADYIRKQTTAQGERFFTPELKEREAAILGAEERIQELESRLFQELRDRVGRQAAEILASADAVAEVDVLLGLAETAVRSAWVRPSVDNGNVIRITNGRHPVVEKFAEEPFVPNDTYLDCGEQRMLIITGPNMAGKSTYLRQVALIVLMAQVGSFVPADAAEVGVVDRVFTRVGAQDDLAGGQSTFMVEMTETANILNNVTDRSLVILDEIGRGTSTYDGLSIAWAVSEYLQQAGARTLFATHFHHLNDLADRLPGIRNYRAAVKEDEHQVIWLRKIVPGGTDRSYGIQVARLAGLPEPVIRRAREILAELEAGAGGKADPNPRARVKVERRQLQLTLFDAEEHPVVEELRTLDLSTTTPIEALTLLYHLQRRARP